MTTHEVLAIDVWGNSVDGYEINDMCRTGILVDLDDNMSDDQVIKAVRKACGHRGDARRYVLDTFGSCSDTDMCITDKKSGKPCYYTRVVEDRA